MPWQPIAHDGSHRYAAPGPHAHACALGTRVGVWACGRVGARGCVGAHARRRSWAGRRGWALPVGGKCGVVLKARCGGHGSLTLSPPGSSGPGHRILLVTETRCPPVPRLRKHGDGCAPGTTGGDPRSLTACGHRWRRRTSWVPHSHGLGRWWQVEGSLGALSASLPWDVPGKVPGCGVAAPLVLGARRAHHRTGPSKMGRGGGSAGGCLASRDRPQLHWSARGYAGLGVCHEVGGARAHLEVPWVGRSRDTHNSQASQAVSPSQPPLFRP